MLDDQSSRRSHFLHSEIFLSLFPFPDRSPPPSPTYTNNRVNDLSPPASPTYTNSRINDLSPPASPTYTNSRVNDLSSPSSPTYTNSRVNDLSPPSPPTYTNSRVNDLSPPASCLNTIVGQPGLYKLTNAHVAKNVVEQVGHVGARNIFVVIK